MSTKPKGASLYTKKSKLLFSDVKVVPMVTEEAEKCLYTILFVIQYNRYMFLSAT